MSGIYKLKRTLQYNKRESEVLKLILKHPGVRYKQVQRIIGLSNGSLTYILKKLEGSRRITVNRVIMQQHTIQKISRLMNYIL